MIKTDNLVIRKFREEDLPDVHRFLCDPAVTAFSGFDPFSIEESREWLRHHVVSYPEFEPLGVFAIELTEANESIGYCGLEKLPPDIVDEIEVTVGVSPEHWGNGYGMEAVSAVLDYAFGKCRLDRVVAVVHAENQKAHRLFRKCGFQRYRELTIKGVGPHVLLAYERF